VTSLHFSPDGAKLLVAYFDGTIELWDVSQRKLVKTYTETQRGGCHTDGLAFSPDSKRVAFVRRDYRAVREPHVAYVYDVESGTKVSSVPLGRACGQCVYLARDGRRLFTIGTVGPVVLDIQSGKQLTEFEPKAGLGIEEPESLAITADESVLRYAYAGAVYSWNLGNRQLLSWHVLADTGLYAFVTGYSASARLFAVSEQDYHRIGVYDALTGTVLSRIASPSKVNALAFTPDDQILVWSDSHDVIHFARTATGEEALRINASTLRAPGHAKGIMDYVTSLAVSPDDSKLASGSYDATTLLWDLGSLGVSSEHSGSPPRQGGP
jgi:WD40 repeat protein